MTRVLPGLVVMVILMAACNDLVEAQAIASTRSPVLRVEWTVDPAAVNGGRCAGTCTTTLRSRRGRYDSWSRDGTLPNGSLILGSCPYSATSPRGAHVLLFDRQGRVRPLSSPPRSSGDWGALGGNPLRMRVVQAPAGWPVDDDRPWRRPARWSPSMRTTTRALRHGPGKTAQAQAISVDPDRHHAGVRERWRPDHGRSPARGAARPGPRGPARRLPPPPGSAPLGGDGRGPFLAPDLGGGRRNPERRRHGGRATVRTVPARARRLWQSVRARVPASEPRGGSARPARAW